MERALVALAMVAVAVVVAAVLTRRRPQAPTGARWAVPVQLDRADFEAPDRPWLVVVFTSATCRSCAGTLTGARALASPAVAVQEVEVSARPDLHRRYGVDAVPMVVVADAEGVVRASFAGPPGASDLWAVMGELRAGEK